jgi:hypothetical protein
MSRLYCPYCGQEKNSEDHTEFCGCRFCGFRSALVDTDDNRRLLIVDRRMPFLKRRCEDLSEQLSEVTIIVDRRVAQDPRDDADRRVNGYHEDRGLGPAPKMLKSEVESSEFTA